jgi:hypothetical protein
MQGLAKIPEKSELLEKIYCQLVHENYSFYPHIEAER